MSDDTYIYTEVATADSLIYQESTGEEIALAAGVPRGSRRDYAFVSGDPDDCHRIAKQYDGKVYRRTLTVSGVRLTLYVCALPGRPGAFDLTTHADSAGRVSIVRVQ